MTKSIDIGKLSDDDLLLLNHEIISQLKSRHRMRERRKLLSFDIGERVVFEGPEGGQVHGIILRVNQKSVTIATDKGTWRVDASCVSKEKRPSKEKNSNVLQLNPVKNFRSS